MWALEDVKARLLTANKRWDKAMTMAEKNLDPAMMHLLGRLRDDLAFVERKTVDALNGVYDQELEKEL